MSIVADITYADIQTGKRVTGNRCPIALALQRADPESVWYVGQGFITRVDPLAATACEYAMPREGRDFVLAFDMLHSVAPFTLRLGEPVTDPRPYETPWYREPEAQKALAELVDA